MRGITKLQPDEASPEIPSDKKRSFMHRLQIQPGWVMLACLAAYSILAFSILYSRYIYFEFKEPTDSAAYMQVAWSMFHWPPFTVSIQENLFNYTPFNFLGDQLMWTLALFAPLCLLPSPGVWFLLAQVMIIAAGAILLYRMASDRLEDEWLALLVTICYLFNAATTLSFARFGFRAETLFIPLAFAIFYLSEKERLIQAGIALVLFLLTKHDSIPVAVLIGLYFIVIRRRQWRFGAFCIVAAIAYYAVGVGLVMSPLQTSQTAHFKHFSQFGDTPRQALVHMVLHPSAVLSLISPAKLTFFFGQILFPAGLLALLSPIFWVCSSALLINAVTPEYLTIYCGWHWAIVIPFIFMGMISTMGWGLKKTRHDWRVRLLLALLLLVQTLYGISAYHTVNTEEEHYSYRKSEVDTIRIIEELDKIEPEASVMASSRLLWFLFNRKHIYIGRVKFHDEADYIAILLPAVQPDLDSFLLREMAESVSKNEFKLKKNLQEMLADPESKFSNYYPVSFGPNLVILKHK